MKITKEIETAHHQVGRKCGIQDLFDDFFKGTFNLTDDEYDFFCERMSDEEIKIMVNEKPTFAQRREMIKIRTKYLNEFNMRK